MKNTKPIYTIGHRNPDTDSICSAIGYAHLKQALGENVVPARAGKVNAETKFALEHFHVEQPLLLTDLYPRVKDVLLDCKIVVKQHDTLRQLGEIMRDHDLRSVPVTDSKGILVGIVTVSDLAKRYFQELGMANLADMRVRYRDIIAAIDAKILVGGVESDFIQGEVRIAAGSIKMIQSHIKEHDIVLIGDRHDETIIDCVKQGISVLIVTGDGRVSADVIEEAEKRGIFVLSTPYDTYTAARLINQCVPVRRIMHPDPVCFKPLDL
ncbi:MAG: DRTGG domain-containing protein, partial [Selenomonas sp.]